MNIQVSQIFPLLWKAVGICELNSLKVIACTCDGASVNYELFKMRFNLTFDNVISSNVNIPYRTRNLHILQGKRFIRFISDEADLLKTTRNCLFNSGSGMYTLVTCGKVKCLFYGIVSLIYFIKLVNLVFIFLAELRTNTLS